MNDYEFLDRATGSTLNDVGAKLDMVRKRESGSLHDPSWIEPDVEFRERIRAEIERLDERWGKARSDKERYARMSEPYADFYQAKIAVAKFFDDVETARDRRVIQNVVVIVELQVDTPDGRQRAESAFSLGDSKRVLPMLAAALGAERARYEDAVKKTVDQAIEEAMKQGAAK